MPKERSQGLAGQPTSARDALRVAIETEAAAQPLRRPEEDDQEAGPDALSRRAMPLEPEALALLSELIPDAPLSDQTLGRIHKRQLLTRHMAHLESEFEKTCDARHPGELIRSLRLANDVADADAARAFKITASQLAAVETGKQPWYTIDASCLPSFASLVNAALEEVIVKFQITAKRSVLHAIEQRAGGALGRFDVTQEQLSARRDSLRLAYGAVEKENVGAARFLASAERLLEGLT